jgi:hypothetical protein
VRKCHTARANPTRATGSSRTRRKLRRNIEAKEDIHAHTAPFFERAARF